MGFTSTDLFGTNGVYETCKYIEDYVVNAEPCDYERVITCYDGASVGIYSKYLDPYDWYDGYQTD